MDNEAGFKLWLEFELWEGRVTSPDTDFFNMTITLPNGLKYALNVWTYNYLLSAKENARNKNEYVGGVYMPAPDVFVEKLDRQLIEVMTGDMIKNNLLKEVWLIVDE